MPAFPAGLIESSPGGVTRKLEGVADRRGLGFGPSGGKQVAEIQLPGNFVMVELSLYRRLPQYFVRLIVGFDALTLVYVQVSRVEERKEHLGEETNVSSCRGFKKYRIIRQHLIHTEKNNLILRGILFNPVTHTRDFYL